MAPSTNITLTFTTCWRKRHTNWWNLLLSLTLNCLKTAVGEAQRWWPPLPQSRRYKGRSALATAWMFSRWTGRTPEWSCGSFSRRTKIPSSACLQHQFLWPSKYAKIATNMWSVSPSVSVRISVSYRPHGVEITFFLCNLDEPFDSAWCCCSTVVNCSAVTTYLTQ